MTFKANLAVFAHRDFSLLWWGGLVSYLGNWMLIVGMPVTVFRLTGSASATAVMVAAGVLPKVFLSPFIGVLVDRWDRRRVMVFGNLAAAALLTPLLLVDERSEIWICAAVSAGMAAVSPFVSIAEDALLPRLVPDGLLPAANALNSLNNNTARLVGPMIGGLVVLSGGLPTVVAADAATFALAAVLVLAVRGGRGAGTEAEAPVEAAAETHPVRRFAREFGQGLGVIARSRALVVLMVFYGLVAFGDGAFASVFVAYAENVVDGGANAYGWLIAAQAVGGIVGGLTAGWFAGRRPLRPLLGVATLLFGLVDLFTFNYPKLWTSLAPGIVAMIVVGVPSTVMFASAQTLTQRASTDAFRGRVFAVRGTVMSGCMLLGTILAVVLGRYVDVVTILNVQGVAPLLAGVLVLSVRTDRPRPDSRDHADTTDDLDRRHDDVKDGATTTT